MLLPELEREAIISQRLEEKQRVLDKVNVSIFLKTHRKRPESPEAETVSGAAKRRSKRPMMLMSDGNLNAFNSKANTLLLARQQRKRRVSLRLPRKDE